MFTFYKSLFYFDHMFGIFFMQTNVSNWGVNYEKLNLSPKT